MATLQDIINLAKADGGKFFVMDETGEAKLVILSIEDYQKLLLGKLQRQIKQQAVDIEKINREILKAQLQEGVTAKKLDDDPPTEFTLPVTPVTRGPKVTENYHHDMPRQDLRAEVIDPSFDFEGPKVEIDDL